MLAFEHKKSDSADCKKIHSRRLIFKLIPGPMDAIIWLNELIETLAFL